MGRSQCRSASRARTLGRRTPSPHRRGRSPIACCVDVRCLPTQPSQDPTRLRRTPGTEPLALRSPHAATRPKDRGSPEPRRDLETGPDTAQGLACCRATRRARGPDRRYMPPSDRPVRPPRHSPHHPGTPPYTSAKESSMPIMLGRSPSTRPARASPHRLDDLIPNRRAPGREDLTQLIRHVDAHRPNDHRTDVQLGQHSVGVR